MKRILFSIFCLFAFHYAHAEAWTPETVPSPKTQGQDYYVANPDGVLTQETVHRLNAGLAQLYRDTYVELAVVAIDEMGGDQRHMPHNFALHLFNNWGIGDKDKNTGVLVFLARSSRDIQIITGKGIEGILTDGTCGEILDNNIDYLADNDFDEGILHICEDIANKLMTDESRAELLLGWKPEETKVTTFWTWYFIIGFLLLIIFTLWGNHVLESGKPGEAVKDVQSRADDVRMGIGCMTCIFPLPLLFYYIYYLIAKGRIKRKPFLCKKCGHDMTLLDDEHKIPLLTKSQLFERQIEAYDFEVWQCPDCGEVKSTRLKSKNSYKYDLCPQCNTYAMLTTERKTIEKATTSKNGKQQNTLVCQYCGHTITKELVLRKENYSSSRSSGGLSSWLGGDSSSYSDSWGDSGSSSGSWGGGSSSGGGAGRSF